MGLLGWSAKQEYEMRQLREVPETHLIEMPENKQCHCTITHIGGLQIYRDARTEEVWAIMFEE